MQIKLKMGRVIGLLVVMLFWATSAVSQNRVVVIPMGSDVSAQQFNDLVNQVNRSHVFSGYVQSNGSKAGIGLGHYTPTRVSEGVYDVTILPPMPQYEGLEINSPNVVITSQGVARIPDIDILDLLSDRIRFRVTLRAFDGTIADASFFFHVQFSEFSPQIDGPSDRRLKTNVSKIAVTSTGTNVYQFNYINDPLETDYVGVMAQEILTAQPDAVRLAEDGFYRVNYFKLGLRMSTLKHWNKFGLGAIEMAHYAEHSQATSNHQQPPTAHN